MADVAKRYQDELERIKKNTEDAYSYFKDNYNRFHEFRKFVFETTLSSDEISLLKELGKPQIEFNILEAFISRLRGEFSEQVPSISVRSPAGNLHPIQVELVETHLRSSLFDANLDGMENDIFMDLVSGGFSTCQVFPEYTNNNSFDHHIVIKRVFDPTLCGFDPLAEKAHKGDGRYCFQHSPITKEEFEEKYGKDSAKDFKFSRSEGEFNWSYRNGKEKIIIICDYYEKKKKKIKIVQLSDGRTMDIDKYKNLVEEWNNKMIIEQPPIIVRTRQSFEETICRYRFVENKVLEYEETDFDHFPFIFVDANSVMLRETGTSGSVKQLTRPAVYHAKGIQKLKNFAGQTLANELENMIQHKFMVSKDSIPSDYSYAYQNVQKADVLVYNQYKDNDPTIPLNPPGIVQRAPIPPEITNTFQLSDQVTQAILGNFDASLARLPTNDVSGIAIQESISLGNSTAKPIINGFLQGLNRIAEIFVALIPKYYVTERTIPIKGKDGKHQYIHLDPKSGILDYDHNDIEVKVEAGVNFQIQRSQAMKTILGLMQASPLFAQFMNTEGLPILLDNVDIEGIDQLKKSAEEWAQQQKKQQQMMQQQQAQQGPMANPIMAKIAMEQQKLQLDQQKLQESSQKNQLDAKIKLAELAQSQQELDTDRIRIAAELKQARLDAAIEIDKANAEKLRSHAELAMEQHDMTHRHAMDISKHGLDQHKHIESSRNKNESI